MKNLKRRKNPWDIDDLEQALLEGFREIEEEDAIHSELEKMDIVGDGDHRSFLDSGTNEEIGFQTFDLMTAQHLNLQENTHQHRHPVVGGIPTLPTSQIHHQNNDTTSPLSQPMAQYIHKKPRVQQIKSPSITPALGPSFPQYTDFRSDQNIETKLNVFAFETANNAAGALTSVPLPAVGKPRKLPSLFVKSREIKQKLSNSLEPPLIESRQNTGLKGLSPESNFHPASDQAYHPCSSDTISISNQVTMNSLVLSLDATTGGTT